MTEKLKVGDRVIVANMRPGRYGPITTRVGSIGTIVRDDGQNCYWCVVYDGYEICSDGFANHVDGYDWYWGSELEVIAPPIDYVEKFKEFVLADYQASDYGPNPLERLANEVFGITIGKTFTFEKIK